MMHRLIIAVIVVAAMVMPAQAINFQLKIKSSGVSSPALVGKLLLVDGVSFILLVDGSSKICLAGGC